MPRHFYRKGSLEEWAKGEQGALNNPELASMFPKDYQPIDFSKYEHTSNGQGTIYKPAQARFDPKALAARSDENMPGGEARVYRFLRECGVTHIVGRYDGGHDEGFAYFEEAITPTSRFSPDEVVRAFSDGSIGNELNHSYVDMASYADLALDHFAGYLAVQLLHGGYGTGDYSLIGRFRADLQTGLITDEDVSPDEIAAHESEMWGPGWGVE